MRDADPGLFGPGSVTWQLHADPVMWVAGVRALYLQALHPRAVRAVMQNSDFKKDAWGRLLRTADFVGTITYGTSLQAERAGARVRGIHRRLGADDPRTGERFGVDDPELLLWVHCAEIDSYLQIASRSGLPLTGAQADAYVDEQRTAARLVGLDPDAVPDSALALAEYFEKIRPELAAAEDAQAVYEFLRAPPVPWPLLPARAALWGRVAGLAYAALPPFAQELYGRPGPPDAVTGLRLRLAGRVLRTIPRQLRWQLPPGHILKAVGRLGPGSHPSVYKLREGARSLP
ncbi:oxygenase MpaB family protein [Streptomyces sp. H10-C2]|uniref:oxygenase MpaB family protein n=1 Tax=unclassified Streptomyces TaxID=2593676 RepID=UPI0024BB6135|nr:MULTISPECIES: oxygenase MpaB family protein [unclassified Streptomyces]MDJ0344152.1 oxygenase MpaB family protein [Streptomyces sp. PH10-H1]MDJ0373089.1 oxygenase MpaB family protein [Streptomyces sp. H10-C2]